MKEQSGQMSFLDTLFPTKSYAEITREEEAAFEAKLADLTFDEKVIARTYPYLVRHAGDYEDEDGNEIDLFTFITDVADTRKDLFRSGDCEIWCYEIESEKWNTEERCYDKYTGYMPAFRIGDQVITVNFLIENLRESAIYFPAMCMAYMDSSGNPLPYTIRDEFIENGLGLLTHGEYRLGKRDKKSILDFCSLKTTLPKIAGFLKAQADYDDLDCVDNITGVGAEM